MSATRNGGTAPRRAYDFFAVLCCLLFVLTGTFSASSLGIQTDEALFAAGIYGPFSADKVVRILHHDVPVMVMTYVGTVKSLLYRPILAVFPPSAFSVRVPALLIGGLSIWFFYRLVFRTVGPRAAIVGCVLLATDPMYLLTARWDWGPVAIQHLCLTGGLLALLRFHQEKRSRWLALGFFVLGIGLWDKALFAWLLAGAGVAAMATFPREVIKAVRLRTAVVACTFFALGASPLILYNIRHHWVTFRSNTAWSAVGIPGKARLLRETAQGAGLYGAIARERGDGFQREPSTNAERALLWVNARLGEPRHNISWPLWIGSVLLLPFVWRKPAGSAAMFAIVCSLVAWSMMAFTKGAGGGTHHPILLWPMPQMAVAAVLSGVSYRFQRPGAILLASTIALAGLSNLAVTGTYYAHEIRNGGATAWTDAFYPLSSTLNATQARQVCLLEWGFFDNLRLFSQGRLNLRNASPPSGDAGRRIALEQIADGNNVFVTHARRYETSPGITERFLAFAEENGYERSNIRVFYDRNGRGVIEVFRFAPRAGRPVVNGNTTIMR